MFSSYTYAKKSDEKKDIADLHDKILNLLLEHNRKLTLSFKGKSRDENRSEYALSMMDFADNLVKNVEIPEKYKEAYLLSLRHYQLDLVNLFLVERKEPPHFPMIYYNSSFK